MLPLLILGLASIGTASLASPKDEGFMRLPMRRNSLVRSSSSLSLVSRDEPINTTLTQYRGTVYTVELLIGTPVQHVTVQLDTGSDELWVNPNCTKAADPEFCHGAGFYDPGASNSSSVVPSFNGFTIFYEIGSAVGDYYEDNVLIGGANLTHTQFGVATNSSIVDTGILGLSYGSGENINYNNVLDQLYDQSYITRRQFSVAAGSVDNESGDLLFSGLDVKKFAGTLQEVPLIFPGPDGHKTYWVNQTYLGVSSQTSCQSQELSRQEFSAIIDTGASFTILPEDVMKAALAYFPAAVFNENVGAWTIDCQYRDRDATLDFGFGDAIINVPFHELIWEREPNQCLLGLAEAMPGVSAIIGDNFMRAAYVVFDQEKRSVFMANYKDCGSEILASTEDLMLKPGRCLAPTPASSCTPSTSSVVMSSTGSVIPSSTTAVFSTGTASSSSTSSVGYGTGSTVTSNSPASTNPSGSQGPWANSTTCTDSLGTTAASTAAGTGSIPSSIWDSAAITIIQTRTVAPLPSTMTSTIGGSGTSTSDTLAATGSTTSTYSTETSTGFTTQSAKPATGSSTQSLTFTTSTSCTGSSTGFTTGSADAITGSSATTSAPSASAPAYTYTWQSTYKPNSTVTGSSGAAHPSTWQSTSKPISYTFSIPTTFSLTDIFTTSVPSSTTTDLPTTIVVTTDLTTTTRVTLTPSRGWTTASAQPATGSSATTTSSFTQWVNTTMSSDTSTLFNPTGTGISPSTSITVTLISTQTSIQTRTITSVSLLTMSCAPPGQYGGGGTSNPTVTVTKWNSATCSTAFPGN